jgi:hypothetical protein
MIASSSVLFCKSEINPPSSVLRIKHVLVPLCLSEISHELYWDQTQTCAVRSWQLTTWNMAWEKFLDILNYTHFIHIDFNSLFIAIIWCPVHQCVTPHIIVTQLNILAWSMVVQRLGVTWWHDVWSKCDDNCLMYSNITRKNRQDNTYIMHCIFSCALSGLLNMV